MIGPVHLDGSTVLRLTPFDQVVGALRNAVPPGISGHFNGPAYELAAGGTVVATLDGAALTARRTPAVSTLATDDLARPDATRLAVFGTGVQAREHIRAMRWIRPSIDEIDVVGRDAVSTDRFVAMLRGEGLVVRAADRAGASSADVICTCTSSPDPVLDEDAVKPGTHVNAIGGDLGDILLGRASVVVDDRAVVHGDHYRNDADEITVFVSAGLPSADLIVAVLAAGNAGLLD